MGGEGVRGRLAIALLLPAATVAALVLTLVIEAQVPADLAGDELAATRGWATALTGVLMGVLAALILVRDRRQGLGWALAWFGIFWSLDGVAESYVRLGLDTDRPAARR